MQKKILYFIITTMMFLVNANNQLQAVCEIFDMDSYTRSGSTSNVYSLDSGLGDLKTPFRKNDPFFNQYLEVGLKLFHLFEYSQARFIFQTMERMFPDNLVPYALEMISYNQGDTGSIIYNEFGKQRAKELFDILKTKNLDNVLEEENFIKALMSFFEDDNKNFIDIKNREVWKKQQEKFNKHICDLSDQYKNNPDIESSLEVTVFCGLSFIQKRNGAYDIKNNQLGFNYLKNLYEKNPTHPGLMHYMLHLTENPIQAYKSNQQANDISKYAFNSVHGLHMGAHHYFLIGDWKSIIEKTNKAWYLGQEMYKKYSLKEGMEDDFHAIRWIVTAYLQLGKSKDAFNLIKLFTKNDNYSKSGVSSDSAQGLLYGVIDGYKNFSSYEIDYILKKLYIFHNSENLFAKLYYIYANIFVAFKSKNKVLLDNYKDELQKLYKESEGRNSHYLFDIGLKIILKQVNVFNSLLEDDLTAAIKYAKEAVKLEDGYIENFFEPSILIGGLPSNELLAELFFKNKEYNNSLNQLNILEIRYPGRLSARILRENIMENRIGIN